jgi:hypothetical protein
VSDTLGAALWGLELMFQVAAAGAAGISFHAGIHNLHPDRDKAYTPIARSAGHRYRAAPLFYGMLMFAQASRGSLIPVHLARASGGLKAFAVRAADGGLQVCLINKDERRARVTIDPGRSFIAASLMRLSGPGAAATMDVTLGDARVDEFGAWSPATTPVLQSAGQEITVDVPAAGAALISMHA